jgi:hypothetical protein
MLEPRQMLATVGDFVWNDLNGNGLQETDEPGIPGVTVQLFDTSDTVIDSTVTANSGLYSFTEPAGTYSLHFVLPSGWQFTLQNVGADPTIDSDPDPVTGNTADFTLTDTQVDNTLDAGMFLPVTIGDFVWQDVNANGIQDAGEPGIDGVAVSLFDSADTLIDSTVTAGGGLYSFSESPGTYYVHFSLLPGFVFSPQNAGDDPSIDSDPDPVTGNTAVFTLISGQADNTQDVGMFPPSNVTVTLDSATGTLIVLGDAFHNSVVIDQAALKGLRFRVSPGDGSTSINGQAGPQLFDGVRGLNVALNDGDNSLAIQGATVRGDVRYDGGVGTSTLNIQSVRVGGGLAASGEGSASIVMTGVSVGAAFLVTGTDGTDTVDLLNVTVAGAANLGTGLGDDTILIDGSLFRGTLTCDTGQDSDSLTIRNGTRVNGDLTIVNTGDLTATLSDSRAGKSVSFVDTGAGADTISLLNMTLSKTLAFQIGAGDATVEIDGSRVSGATTYGYGGGGNTLAVRDASRLGSLVVSGMGSFDATLIDTRIDQAALFADLGGANDSISLLNVQARKAVSFLTGDGDDAVTIDGSRISGAVTYDHGLGADTLTVQNGARFDGNLTVIGGGSLAASLTDTRVGRALSIVDSDADGDTLDLLNVTVGGTANLVTGSGDDTVTIDDCLFAAAVTLNTGAGADATNIETLATAAGLRTTFKRQLNIVMGDDDDTLTVGAAGQAGSSVSLGGPSLWDGGAGTDTLAAATGQPLGRQPTIVNFENII